MRPQGVNDLTAVSNNAGVDDFGLGLLLQTRQVRIVALGSAAAHGRGLERVSPAPSVRRLSPHFRSVV